MKLRVAALQLNSGPDIKKNLKKVAELVATAARSKAKLVALPENFLIMSERSFDVRAAAEVLKNHSGLKVIKNLAKKYKIWIAAGTLPTIKKKSDKKFFNTSVVVDPQGRVVQTYDKIHLFDVVLKDRVYKESARGAAGQQIKSFKAFNIKMGLSVCYDIRFPELYREFSGAQIIFIPSAFTVPTGEAHWDVLTRARAIENQAFVVASAQWGTHPGGRETYGHTRIVDAWGRVVAEKKSGVGFIVADLDLRELEQIRFNLPVLKHRRI